MVISNLNYIAIIVGSIIAEKNKTEASWWNVVIAELDTIAIVIIIAIIAELIARSDKNNKVT